MFFAFVYSSVYFVIFFFFFQAEDGIRDVAVTGVQTCALPILNGQYLSMTPAEDLFPLVAPQLEKLGVNGNREAVLKAIAAVKTRSRTTLDVARQVAARLDAKHLGRSEEHTAELQSRLQLVCRLLLEKKKKRALGICTLHRRHAR